MDKITDDKAGKKAGLIAFPLEYAGPDTYAKAFEGTDYGLVLDDDGETGYLYVTTAGFQEVLDEMHLYNAGESAPSSGERLYFVWNPALLKAGVYFKGRYQAIVDFGASTACCRGGNPDPDPSGWCRSSHRWDPRMLVGLTFGNIEE